MAKLETYLIHYTFSGVPHAFTLPAYSREDAEAKVRAIGVSGKVVGSNVQIMEVPAQLSWFGMLWTSLNVMIRNFGRKSDGR